MYIPHRHRPLPHRFRFVDRSDRGHVRDLSVATCNCFAWSCFMTTRERAHELWLEHTQNSNSINNNPTPNETETTR
jgi:hypothetical protein